MIDAPVHLPVGKRTREAAARLCALRSDRHGFPGGASDALGIEWGSQVHRLADKAISLGLAHAPLPRGLRRGRSDVANGVDDVNPLPLRGPDRVIYAYACETCGKVPIVGESVFIPTPEERKVLVARHRKDSYGKAAKCCTCMGCGAVLGPSERKPHPIFGETVRLGSTHTCEACAAKEQIERVWHRWCWAWGDIGRAIANGVTDIAGWRALNEEDDDE